MKISHLSFLFRIRDTHLIMTTLRDITWEGICFCGGKMDCNFLERTYDCTKCRFCISFRELISVPEHSVPRLVRNRYKQFQKSKEDPMNVLPSYYKKSV